MEVPSPCIKICTLDANDVCTGCGRRIEEIAVWGGASNEYKQRIVEAARRRLAAMQTDQQRQAQP